MRTFSSRGRQNGERSACSTAARLRSAWMRRISARDLGSGNGINGDCHHLDLLQDADEPPLLLVRRRCAAHRGKPQLLLRRVLRYLDMRVGEHGFVVGADWADVSAAAAAGDDA